MEEGETLSPTLWLAQRDEGGCPGSLCKWLDPGHDDGDGGDDGDLGPYIQQIFVA